MERIKWNNSMVTEGILEVKSWYKMDRMPSKSEMNAYYENSALTNKISRTGGIHEYARKLNLPIKKCETQRGEDAEKDVAKQLEKMGYRTELTSNRHPYDILVNGRVKIDVKMGNPVISGGSSTSKGYTFNLEKPQQTCDVFVVVCMDENNKTAKEMVIPSSVLNGKTQLVVGISKSRYDKYINAWEIIKMYDVAFEQVEGF